MLQLSQELTSGLTSDTGQALRNDFSIQMSWERSIASSRVREQTLAEALTRIEIKQAALSSISDSVGQLANDADLALANGTTRGLAAISQNAKDKLDQTISNLNVQSAGKFLFSGSQTNQAALASKQDILASVVAAISGASTATDVLSGVESWMNDPVDGYPAIAYVGGAESSAKIRLSGDRSIEENSRADDQGLQKAVQGLILASLAMDPQVGLSNDGRALLLKSAAEEMRVAEGQVVEMQASLGYIEAEVVKNKTQATTEISLAEQLRTSTLGIDQYETASKLQQAELQLEKIYAMTARSQRLSLLEYL
ncbi:hypothetical protein [Planktotalea sp.]|uniref:hypothetical protein n=1 Tax=Planktotalea sp. TaxID=2029877 RepID=UPI003D6A69A1